MTKARLAMTTREDRLFGDLRFHPPRVDMCREGGNLLLRSPRPLPQYKRSIVEYLRDQAARAPEHEVLVQRAGGGRRAIAYAGLRKQADAIGQALLDMGAVPGDMLAILAPNSLENAAVMFGAMTIGVTVAPLSYSYTQFPGGYERLADMMRVTGARFLFVDDAPRLALLLAQIAPAETRIISAIPSSGVMSFEELIAVQPTQAVEAAFRATGPDTVAKILFTSGSTGSPKGVINTQRMMCSNQAMAGQVTLRSADIPPVVLDWLPWHHTFGGNFNLNEVLRTGGTLWIDDGKPLRGPQFERTISAIKAVRPTVYGNVPLGYQLLVEAMREDLELRHRFFERLEVMRYGGAALPSGIYEELQQMAEAERGHRIPVTCGFAMTETAPSVTSLHWPIDGTGGIGLPFAGVEMKLAPLDGDRYEIRVKGPCVFPGYLHDAELTAAAFDEDGYFRTGDACRFVDPTDPERGLFYDGRVSEDFKLQTGTWVHVGALRAGLVGAASPYVRDAVITGEGRHCIGALVWLGQAADALVAGEDRGVIIPSEALKVELQAALGRWAAENAGSSRRVAFILLMAGVADPAVGEINDKGYVNQRCVRTLRSGLVDRLYSGAPDAARIELNIPSI